MALAEFSGVDELAAVLRLLAGDAEDAAAAGLYEIGEERMTIAKQRTPVARGNLRNSGHVAQPVKEGDAVTVVLGFGGPAADYAVFVHENLRAQHHVGQAKFLESAVLDGESELGTRLAGKIVSAWERRSK